MYLLYVAVLCCFGAVFAHSPHHCGQENADHFINEWIAHVDAAEDEMEGIARDLGYKYIGPVDGFENVFHLRREDHPTKSKRHAPEHTDSLNDHHKIKWAEQLFQKQRVKRDFQPLQRMKRDSENIALIADNVNFNDPMWPDQWYLHDTRTSADLPLLDLQVLPVYKKGITGKGVRVCVLDDGLQWRHPDLNANYDPEISYDVNGNDNDPDARMDSLLTNAHGTRCAGEIAMIANNDVCGVGVAYNSNIGGIRMLDGSVTDATEGRSLGFAHDKIDIFSVSWGPNDDGKTVEGPGRLAEEAIEHGITKGRNGKGVIYVWASGNGGVKGDNCDCDGYTSSIYTLAVGSASQHGHFPWYGELCSSTMSTTQSSGDVNVDQKISTTDLMQKYTNCTDQHTGTSASAPLGAGIVALALEANPDLTWRDVQHIVLWGSEYEPVKDNIGWCENAAGFRYNPRFGFGLMNASRIVELAEDWVTVPKKYICSAKAPESRTERDITAGQDIVIEVHTDGCVDKAAKEGVRYLEHVEVIVDIQYSTRGALEIYLVSPMGTPTSLLTKRKQDRSAQGFKNWSFMSVHTWGENPAGDWKLIVRDNTGTYNQGRVEKVEIRLHGTYKPQELQKERRNYKLDLPDDASCDANKILAQR